MLPRGIGHTSLMIANLPDGKATIVYPTRDIAREVTKRVHLERPTTAHQYKHVIIRDFDDVDVLDGLSEPVFFDNSFWALVDLETAVAATERAAIASRHRHFTTH